MRQFSPLSWYLCVVEHCHEERGNYVLSSSVFSLSYLGLHERGFKRQTLRLWRVNENCGEVVAQRTVNRILRDRATYSYETAEHCHWKKQWLCWGVGMWSTEDQLRFDVWSLFLGRLLFLYKRKSITFWLYLVYCLVGSRNIFISV